MILDENRETDLYSELSISLQHAQEDADRTEYYKMVYNAVESEFGSFKRENRTITKTDGKKNYEVLVFKLDNVLDISDLVNRLYDEYAWYNDVDFTEESYGNLFGIIRDEIDLIEINDDYGVHGQIDEKNLNEIVSERIYDL